MTALTGKRISTAVVVCGLITAAGVLALVSRASAVDVGGELIKRRVAALEEQIASMILQRGEADELRRKALDAKLGLKIITTQFYRLALAEQSLQARSLLAVRAEGLWYRQVLFSEAFDGLPAMAAQYAQLQQQQPRPVAQLRLLQRRINAIIEFEKFTRNLPDRRKDPLLQQWSRQLARRLIPLVSPDGRDEPGVLPPARPEARVAPRGATDSQRLPTMQELVQSVRGANMALPVRKALLDVLKCVSTRIPSPQTEKTFAAAYRSFRLAKIASDSDLLLPAAKAALDRQMQISLLLLQDRRTYDSAEERLAAGWRLGAVLKDLRGQNFSEDERRRLGNWIQRVVVNMFGPDSSAVSGQLDSLGRFAKQCGRYADILNRPMPQQPAMAKLAGELRKRYLSNRAAAINVLVGSERGETLKQCLLRMRRYAEDLALVQKLPATLELLKQCSPRAPALLEKQFTDLARQLLQEKAHNSAFTSLREVVAVVGRLRQCMQLLPVDPQALVSVLGPEELSAVRQRVVETGRRISADFLRVAVLTPHAEVLTQAAVLLESAWLLHRGRELSKAIGSLNHWCAWQLSPRRYELLQEKLKRLTKAAVADWLAERPEGLGNVIERIKSLSEVNSAVVEMGEMFGRSLLQHPSGLAEALGKLAPDPRRGYLRPVEENAAAVCLLVLDLLDSFDSAPRSKRTASLLESLSERMATIKSLVAVPDGS